MSDRLREALIAGALSLLATWLIIEGYIQEIPATTFTGDVQVEAGR